MVFGYHAFKFRRKSYFYVISDSFLLISVEFNNCLNKILLKISFFMKFSILLNNMRNLFCNVAFFITLGKMFSAK